jgi:hypothetical protein
MTGMGGLIQSWHRRLADNARMAVEAYQEELAEYRALAADPRESSGMLDFAVFLRRRTVALVADDAPFAAADLDLMADMGRRRAEQGVTLNAQRQVLLLHTRLTLREVYEAAGPNDIDATMRVLAWLAPAGLAAQGAYTRGWLDGRQRMLSQSTRVGLLTSMLLAGDAATDDLARGLGLPLGDRMLATVVRIGGAPAEQAVRERVVDTLLRNWWMPILWRDSHEIIALVPGGDTATRRAVGLARDVASLLSLPCAVGTVPARRPSLADAVALARRVGRAAPLRAVPRQAYTLTDVFAEIGAAQMPEVGEWMRAVAGRLAAGPDLVTTLDAYYQQDMNRLRAAAALSVHPRTLDYRLARVRELTGLDPGSTRGVRLLSTVVAWTLAGG